MDSTRSALTYQPRSAFGKYAVYHNLPNNAKPIGDFFSSLERASGDFGYNLSDGNATVGALFSALPDAALIFLGPGGSAARSSVVNVGKGTLAGARIGSKAVVKVVRTNPTLLFGAIDALNPTPKILTPDGAVLKLGTSHVMSIKQKQVINLEKIDLKVPARSSITFKYNGIEFIK